MAVQSAHNLRQPQTQEPRPYGVRVSLNTNDPFRKILGPDWQRVHWYTSAEKRDAALAEMSRKIGLTNADVEALEHPRETRPAEPLRF